MLEGLIEGGRGGPTWKKSSWDVFAGNVVAGVANALDEHGDSALRKRFDWLLHHAQADGGGFFVMQAASSGDHDLIGHAYAGLGKVLQDTKGQIVAGAMDHIRRMVSVREKLPGRAITAGDGHAFAGFDHKSGFPSQYIAQGGRHAGDPQLSRGKSGDGRLAKNEGEGPATGRQARPSQLMAEGIEIRCHEIRCGEHVWRVEVDARLAGGLKSTDQRFCLESNKADQAVGFFDGMTRPLLHVATFQFQNGKNGDGGRFAGCRFEDAGGDQSGPLGRAVVRRRVNVDRNAQATVLDAFGSDQKRAIADARLQMPAAGEFPIGLLDGGNAHVQTLRQCAAGGNLCPARKIQAFKLGKQIVDDSLFIGLGGTKDIVSLMRLRFRFQNFAQSVRGDSRTVWISTLKKARIPDVLRFAARGACCFFWNSRWFLNAYFETHTNVERGRRSSEGVKNERFRWFSAERAGSASVSLR